MTVLPVAERLTTFIEVAESGCHRWTRSRNSRGYGLISIDGKVLLTHRVAYELHHGPIPDGLTIDHVRARGCVHKDCVNPGHLEAVTQQVNNSRTEQSTKTHCKRDHPLSGDNLFFKKRAGGRVERNCRTCTNMLRRVDRRKKPAA